MDKRFNNKTKGMLTSLLQDVLTQQIPCVPVRQASANWFTDIHIMDSTEFTVSKKAAHAFPDMEVKVEKHLYKIQFEYQLLESKVTSLSIGSALCSDSIEGMKNIDNIPAKTLLLRDLGYFSPKTFKELSRHNIYFISRAKSQWNFDILHEGKYILLTTSTIISKLKDQKNKYVDLDVYVGEQARTPVRLVASLLTDEQKEKRLKKKSSNRKLGADALESIGLNLFVTNV